MSRFISCGELRNTDGTGIELPFFLTMKSGVVRGDFGVTKEFVKNGRMVLPVEIKEVSGSFHCTNNELTSLVGAPSKVGGDFWCFNNKLTSLKGAPKEVKGDFWCQNNKLTSLKGAPKEVKGDFYCRNNPRKFTEEEVRAVCNVKGRVHV